MLIRELIYQEMIEDIKKACQVMSEGGVIFVSDRYDFGA